MVSRQNSWVPARRITNPSRRSRRRNENEYNRTETSNVDLNDQNWERERRLEENERNWRNEQRKEENDRMWEKEASNHQFDYRNPRKSRSPSPYRGIGRRTYSPVRDDYRAPVRDQGGSTAFQDETSDDDDSITRQRGIRRGSESRNIDQDLPSSLRIGV